MPDGLGTLDGGVPFGLGDCRQGGDHKWRKARFLLDAPYLHAFGRYSFRRVYTPEAIRFARAGVVCSVTSETAAEFLCLALRMSVVWSKKAPCFMERGDEALAPVFPGKAPSLERLMEQGLTDLKYKLGIFKRID